MIPKFQANTGINIKDFVSEWNIKYPYDFWWRKKHSVPFGSEKHLSMNHIYMVVEYVEDMFYEKLREAENDEEKELYNSVLSTEGEGVKQVVKMNKKELEQEFDNINLNDF